jgi:hypothetical protein
LVHRDLKESVVPKVPPVPLESKARGEKRDLKEFKAPLARKEFRASKALLAPPASILSVLK